MFQDMNQLLQESMAPFKKMMEIQQEMLERITRQQIECTQQCIEATMAQAAALQKAENPQQFIEMQKDYTKRLEEALVAARDSNVQTVQQAQKAVQELTAASLGGK
jgi:hypothetical protein